MESNDEQDRKFFDALRDKKYDLAIYHLSPRLYHMYLQAGQADPEEREALEAQMRLSLSKLLMGSSPQPQLALLTLERWFGFGTLREISPFTNPDRERLADLDAQQVAIVQTILNQPHLFLQDRVEISLRVARIRPDSTMGWGECQALAEFPAPSQFAFQPALESWCQDLYRWFKHSSLGGTH